MAASGDKIWHAILTGELPHLRRFRWLVRRMPSAPRCPLCLAPFRGVGGWAMKRIGRGPATMNPRFCDFCERVALHRPGGAEVELSMLIADVRGSTRLAESLGTADFTALMNRFFNAASDAVIDADGLIDKYVGDAIVSLFIPGFAGPEHAARAVSSGLAILDATGNAAGAEPWLPVGIGVHTGTAYVGVVGPGRGAVDVTAMGDAMNVAARLADTADAGELVISSAALDQVPGEPGPIERKTVTLEGISAPVEVGVCRR